MNNGQSRASLSNRSSNPIDNARLKERMVGQTIGARREISSSRQNAAVNNIPARKQPVDSFQSKAQTAEGQFKTGNSYANARRYDKNSPYKHVRVANIENGAASLQRGVLGRPTDNDLVSFLDKIESDPRLHSGRSIRENFAPKRNVSQATPRARQAVASMAKAQRLVQRPANAANTVQRQTITNSASRPVAARPATAKASVQRPAARTVPSQNRPVAQRMVAQRPANNSVNQATPRPSIRPTVKRTV